MLMLSHTPISARVRSEGGFTLIEMLVAMLSSVIVVGALVLLLEVTINQTTRITETVQTNQAGRLTMTKIVDELRSTCLGQGYTPVNEKSTEQKLRFAAAFSEKANIPYTAAAEHEILWNESKQTLTDYKYAGTSGANGNIVFSPTVESASGTRIGEKVSAGEPSGKGIFHYYRYSASATGGAAASERALEEIPLATETTELGSTADDEVAAVAVTFKTGAFRNELLSSETKAKKAVPAELGTQVTFAFSAPNSEAPIKDGPCK
jgi:Tfp pilus assembly protein PilW